MTTRAVKYRRRLHSEARRRMRPGTFIGSRAPRFGSHRLPPVVDLSWRCYDQREGHGGFVFDNHAYGEPEWFDSGPNGENFYRSTCVRCGRYDYEAQEYDI